MGKLRISEEELADCKAWEPDYRGGLEYWLLTGLPDGYNLSDYYPQELIDEIQAEIDSSQKACP
jgi:hypothetical protein